MLRRWLREPLVHFLALGALLFLAYHGWGAGAGAQRIVVTAGQIEALAAVFQRTWQRPPTAAELEGLIGDHIRGEIAAREALALGLDRDDTVIRRRLRQKLEFLAAESIDAAPPGDAELAAWYGEHEARYRTDAALAFRQVYFRSIEDARMALPRLEAGAPETEAGDRLLMLPREMALTPVTEVARVFGAEFAERILAAPAGRWTGPILSGFGAHLVHVVERTAGGAPVLAEVRPLVERDFQAARRERNLAEMYEKLRARYRVSVERRAP